VVSALRGQAGTVVISANRNRHVYAAYAATIADAQRDLRGPLAGIAATLAGCATPWLLTVPVDSPNPPSDLAVRLHDAVLAARADAAVAFDGTRRQPLFALYRASLAESAADALRQGLPVWRWQEQLDVADADFSDNPGAFANLNSAEEFRHWEAARG
jgi:molybdopterin-guanine dinucleotide biosynthesis protein A